jgi:tellurite resistance protein TehA-like permease
MIAVLLFKLPYNGIWIYWISVVVFILDVILFVTFTCISAARYLCFPEIWPAMIRHSTEPLFLGMFPMGLGILIEMIVNVCVPAWGPWAANFAWTLWWIEGVLSVAICLYLPFVMYVLILPNQVIL